MPDIRVANAMKTRWMRAFTRVAPDVRSALHSMPHAMKVTHAMGYYGLLSVSTVGPS
jgi:hypothetical protein